VTAADHQDVLPLVGRVEPARRAPGLGRVEEEIAARHRVAGPGRDLAFGHRDDQVVELERRGEGEIEAVIRIGPNQDWMGLDPGFVQQVDEEEGFVFAIAPTAFEDLRRGRRPIAADADLDRDVTHLLPREGDERLEPLAGIVFSLDELPSLSAHAFLGPRHARAHVGEPTAHALPGTLAIPRPAQDRPGGPDREIGDRRAVEILGRDHHRLALLHHLQALGGTVDPPAEAPDLDPLTVGPAHVGGEMLELTVLVETPLGVELEIDLGSAGILVETGHWESHDLRVAPADPERRRTLVMGRETAETEGRIDRVEVDPATAELGRHQDAVEPTGVGDVRVDPPRAAVGGPDQVGFETGEIEHPLEENGLAGIARRTLLEHLVEPVFLGIDPSGELARDLVAHEGVDRPRLLEIARDALGELPRLFLGLPAPAANRGVDVFVEVAADRRPRVEERPAVAAQDHLLGHEHETAGEIDRGEARGLVGERREVVHPDPDHRAVNALAALGFEFVAAGLAAPGLHRDMPRFVVGDLLSALPEPIRYKEGVNFRPD